MYRYSLLAIPYSPNGRQSQNRSSQIGSAQGSQTNPHDKAFTVRLHRGNNSTHCCIFANMYNYQPNINEWFQCLTKTCFFSKRHVYKKKTSAASLKRREHGLGLPKHIRILLILMNIGYHAILVLNKTPHRVLYCPCYYLFLG